MTISSITVLASVSNATNFLDGFLENLIWDLIKVGLAMLLGLAVFRVRDWIQTAERRSGIPLPRGPDGAPIDCDSASQKLRRLGETVAALSSEFEQSLRDLEHATRTRHEALTAVEASLLTLEEREQVLKERVQQLESVPLPVAEYFASLSEAGERRSARRDYLLFVGGVIMSIVTSAVLKYFGVG